MSENTELRFKVAPVWKGSYNPSTTYNISDEVSFTAENVPIGETTDVIYGHYRSLKNNNTDPLTSSNSWLLILDLSNIESVTKQGIEYNKEFNENETLRKENERQRVENETIRVNNELTRITNENERKSAETRRADAENNRNTAENTRKSNETARSTAEIQRKSKEQERISNETARANAETTRQTNESARQNNETNRRSAETTRQNNETTRQNNENVRQKQEGAATDSPNPTGSRWARYKQAENERTQLFDTAQSNRTTLYNAAEGTPEDEASANGSRWARFKKAEETRDATVNEKVEDITNLQNDVEILKDIKANKDGYYSQMTVGAAETLVGETIDSDDYLIRPTGGADNEVANGAASVIGIEGNSRVWNQLCPNNITTGIGYTRTSTSITITDNTITNFNSDICNIGVTTITNHKYYAKSITSTPYLRLINYNVGGGKRNATNGIVFTESSGYSIMLGFEQGIENGTYPLQIIFIDLTAIFGAGNEPTTVAEFEEWLAKNVGLKPYYGYNAGSLLSAQTLGIKTYGQNLLNPTTRQARLITYNWEDNSNVYTIKNIPSGATATFTPDATGVAETVDISGGSLDITSYGSGILELSAATSETYVCMKWDEGKDDDVVPFEEHTQTFDVRKVYGKVNGAGEYVQCFPNGLRGIGDIKDTLNANEAVVRIGSRAYQNGDDSNPDVITDGTTTLYVLSTPITYTDLVYRDGGIDTPITDVLFNIDVDNWSIEEQLLTPYDENGNPTAVPAKISTNYGMDAVEEIDTIKHTYVSAYNEQEFSDTQKAQARRNIGAVEPDGSYANMSVGIAKNLAGEHSVEAKYIYRQSGGTTGTNTGIANVTTVKGKTLVWNQLVRSGMTEVTTISGRKYYTRIAGTSSIVISTGSNITLDDATKDIVIDLTLMFGAGNESSTVEEFEALYPLDYYDYNAGTLVSNNASAIETTGFNLINAVSKENSEQYIGHYYIQPNGNMGRNNSYNAFRVKVFPNTTYFYKKSNNTTLSTVGIIRLENSDKQQVGVNTLGYNKNSVVFTTPIGCYYLLVAVSINQTFDLQLNLSDPAKNGTYEPYEKHTFYFDKVLQSEGSLATIKGKLNGEGESVVVFPDGLRKAGNVCDEIKGNVAIKRIGSRAYNSGDESDATVITDGTNTYYALSESETYILDQTVTGGYQVNANGTERRLPEDTASSVNAPVNYSVIYPINAVKTIINLPINYISAESMTNFTTELATKLGAFLNATIAITPTYDQTNQKYDYNISITQN